MIKSNRFIPAHPAVEKWVKSRIVWWQASRICMGGVIPTKQEVAYAITGRNEATGALAQLCVDFTIKS